MHFEILKGIFIPFLGTLIGSAAVFFLKGEPKSSLSRFLSGFAAGVMIAASIWSLLIPAIEASAVFGSFAFLPATLGFFVGIIALLFTDRYLPLDIICKSEKAGSNTAILVLAVTLHNLPEGVAVGAVYAGLLSGSTDITLTAAFALAIGIGLQNLPEGAIISMPLYSVGLGRKKAFLIGVLSGIVEPIGAALALLFYRYIAALPFLLSFAAGAMVYVVIEELIPEASNKRDKMGVLSFSLGFLIMMMLDVALG